MAPLRDCKVRAGLRRSGTRGARPGPAAATRARGAAAALPAAPAPDGRPGPAGVRPSGGRCPPVRALGRPRAGLGAGLLAGGELRRPGASAGVVRPRL